MRLIHLLPLVALGTAFVIPDEQILNSLSLEDAAAPRKSVFDNLPSPEEVLEELDDSVTKVLGCARHKFEDAVDYTFDTAAGFNEKFENAFACQSWFDSADYDLDL